MGSDPCGTGNWVPESPLLTRKSVWQETNRDLQQWPGCCAAMAGVVGEGADNINHWPVFSWLVARVRGTGLESPGWFSPCILFSYSHLLTTRPHLAKARLSHLTSEFQVNE